MTQVVVKLSRVFELVFPAESINITVKALACFGVSWCCCSRLLDVIVIGITIVVDDYGCGRRSKRCYVVIRRYLVIEINIFRSPLHYFLVYSVYMDNFTYLGYVAYPQYGLMFIA